MRRFVTILSLIFAFTVFANHSYTRAELERMSHSELVDIIVHLQGDGDGGDSNCSTIDPLAGERPAILSFVNNPGYTNHGTLKWPNGETFLLRNSGYTNDKTLYYPNGSKIRLENQGYTNDGTMYWPNGQTMVLRNTGYTNDGTIYRNDGSIWLRRNTGYSNDRERYGLL